MLDNEASEINNCPPSLICPITQVIMEDPYIDPDGNSYEKKAIMDWLQNNEISPITRNKLTSTQLTPNRVLKSLIEDYKAGKFPFSKDTVSATNNNESLSNAIRKPIFLIAVIDTSGSMQLPCGNKENNDEGEFSRLDLVKHTLNTIISSLYENDQICIIKFSTSAEIFARPSSLNENNKKVLIERVMSLRPEYQTNLWDGIRAALDVATNIPEPTVQNINTEIFVLTDGEPNINPPRPIQETVERYMQRQCKTMSRPPRIHTFGYGYNLQSRMLYQISEIGKGCFGFIPDASMVGTVFINALSNCLTTASADCSSLMNGNDGAVLQLQQSVINLCDQFCTLISSVLNDSDAGARIAKVKSFVTTLEKSSAELHNQPVSSDTASTVFSSIATETGTLKEFVDALLTDCRPSNDPNVGQISKAVENDFFEKWGQHYLWSVLSAFRNRVCVNFKDSAMQSFKTPVFSTEQERVEELFLDIKPPVPSIVLKKPGNHATGAAPAPINMRTYYNFSGGCFTADSLIIAAYENHSVIQSAGELKAGSVVLSDKGWTTVEYVVKIRYHGPLFKINGMTLTEYHPMLLQSEHHPDTLMPCFAREEGVRLDGVFDGLVIDLVLSNRGLVASPATSRALHSKISNIDEEKIMFAATFGHTCMLPKFIHPYFGSEAVVDDIKRIAQQQKQTNGEVFLLNYRFLRDPSTNLVSGIETSDIWSSSLMNKERVVPETIANVLMI